MIARSVQYLVFVLILSGLVACGEKETAAPASIDEPAPAAQGELTPAELEHGIGPIKEVTLGPLDAGMADQGMELFKIKCSACHKLETRYIGPALADVTTQRSPAYIMNMILNPEEMTARHPEARKLLAEYAAPMANQNLTEAEARAILEYLRQAAPSE